MDVDISNTKKYVKYGVIAFVKVLVVVYVVVNEVLLEGGSEAEIAAIALAAGCIILLISFILLVAIKYNWLWMLMVILQIGILIVCCSIVCRRGVYILEQISDRSITMAYILIFLGILSSLICGLGYHRTEISICILIIYVVCLLAVMVAEMSIGIYLLGHRDDTNFSEQLSTLHATDVKTFYVLQDLLQCCGIQNDSFYGLNPFPLSCCKNSTITCNNDSPDKHEIGCSLAVTNRVASQTEVLGSLAIASAIIQLIAVRLGYNVTKKQHKKTKSNTIPMTVNEST